MSTVKKSAVESSDVVRAHAKYIRTSPYKLRRVVDEIRGKAVSRAFAILDNLPQKGAREIRKVLHSAVSNAVHNNKLQAESLYISTILVNEGPHFKRFQPKGRGRIYEILKRTSHVIVGLNSTGGKS